eukprot:14845790-Alexandrium_andersonii.AAC.1
MHQHGLVRFRAASGVQGCVHVESSARARRPGRARKQANHPRPEEFRLLCGLVRSYGTRSYPAPAAGCANQPS